jgi:hypothetical protein
MRFALVGILLVGVSACAGAAKQVDSRGLAPRQPGGRVVELAGLRGDYPRIESAHLYFYPGEFEIPLEPQADGIWRGDVSPEQVRGMARQPYGFRVYRARLTIVSLGASGEKGTKTQDLTIALEP